MPRTSYNVGAVGIATSRSHFVAYGSDDPTNPTFHGVLRDACGNPITSSSATLTFRRIIRGFEREEILHRQVGHPTRSGRPCSTARCEERFFQVPYRGESVAAIPIGELTSFYDGWSGTRLLPNRAPLPNRPAFSWPTDASTGLPESFAPLESIGVELECGVPPSADDALLEFVRRECRSRGDLPHNGRDGSLHFSLLDGVRLEPREMTFYSARPSELVDWLRVAYEQAHVVTNDTCGFHLHVRAPETDRWVMATRHYWDGFYSAYWDWANTRPKPAKYRDRLTAFYSRAMPWSRSCIRTVLSDVNSASRYAAINLQSLVKHTFGTVEHRVFPHQETAAEARETVSWLARTSAALVSAARIPMTPEEKEMVLRFRRVLAPHQSDREFAELVESRSAPRDSAPVRLPWEAVRDMEA